MPSQRIGTELAAHAVQKWAAQFRTSANEERVVTRHFDQGAEVNKFGNLLNIRKIGPVTVQTLSTTGDPTSINWHVGTEPNVTASPTFYYAGVEIGFQALMRTGDWPSGPRYAKAYRQQIAAAAVAREDADAAMLAASLTTTVRGGPTENITEAGLLDTIGALITASKNHSNINQNGSKPLKFMVYHPTQWKHVMKIPSITQAHLRGGNEAPLVKGVISEALGTEFAESGNVYQSTVTHNLIYLPTAYVLGYNQEFTFEEPVRFLLAYRFLGFAESAAAEVFDEDAAVYQTSLTG